MICITEATIQTWTIDRLSHKIIPGKKKNLPSKVISAKQSDQNWGDSNILLLTVNSNWTDQKKEVCLWTCSPELRFSLLLKDDSGKLLGRDSFYNFITVEDQQPAQQSQPASQLTLMCTTGRDPPKLRVYMMPDAQSEAEYTELSME